MEPRQVLANLAAAGKLDEMKSQLDSFDQAAPWYARYCTFIRSRVLSIGIDEVYALTDRISRLVIENRALAHDPQAFTYLRQIERKLYPDASPSISILSSYVTKELLDGNCLCIRDSSISLKMLGQLLLNPLSTSVYSVKVPFQDSFASIPVALVKEACRSYPNDSLATFVTNRCREQLAVTGQIIFVTAEVLQQLFSIPAVVRPEEASCYPFPEISPLVVIHFLNTLISPEVYHDGNVHAYLQVTNSGQISIRTLFREYVTLIDFLQHPASKIQLKRALLYTLNRALGAQDMPSVSHVKSVFLLMELLEQHEAIIEQPVYKALEKYVAKFFGQTEGISISTLEQFCTTSIPFEGLQVVVRLPFSLFSTEHIFKAVHTQSIIGHKIVSSDEALFCSFINGELVFLPKLARDASDKKERVKAKNIVFLLSSQAAREPVWNISSLLSSKECILIAQVLEGTKEIEIQDAVNAVAIAKRANSRVLYQAALSLSFMAAQKKQESTAFRDLYTILNALQKLRQIVFAIKDCTHLYSIAEYMVARCIQSTGLPKRVKDGYRFSGDCWQVRVAEYNNGGPLYNYDSPRERIQDMCNDLNMRELNLSIDQEKAAEGLAALDGFTTIESLTIVIDSEYVLPVRFLGALRQIPSLKTLRLQGFSREKNVPYSVAEVARMLQLSPKVQLLVD